MKLPLSLISEAVWEIPQSYRQDMKVPARIFTSEKMLPDIFKDRSIEQLINVATLPGIQKAVMAMPDIHEGYGFPKLWRSPALISARLQQGGTPFREISQYVF